MLVRDVLNFAAHISSQYETLESGKEENETPKSVKEQRHKHKKKNKDN